MTEAKVKELAINGVGSGAWGRVNRQFPRELREKVDEYCRRAGISRESLLTAASYQLLACYVPEEDLLSSLYLYRSSLIAKLQVPAFDGLTTASWLMEIERSSPEGSWDCAVLPGSDETRKPQNPLGSMRLIMAAAADWAEAMQFARGHADCVVVALDCSGSDASLSLSRAPSHMGTETAEILLDCLLHLIGQMPVRAAEPATALTLVPPAIRDCYLAGSQIPVGPVDPRLVHERIAEQARLAPGAIAAIFRDTPLTYAELSARAESLAVRLRRLGSGPGILVAIHLGRSLDLIVSIVAVLQTGAAFVPLDQSLPHRRVEAVMQDSQAPLVITTASLADRFENGKARLLLVDADCEAIDADFDPTEPVAPSPGDLAYVIYTSGSTGTPKGVMIEHRNLASFLEAFDPVASPASGTMLAMASISFDMSISEVLWPLSRGMSIVIHEGDEGSPVFVGPDSVFEQIVRYRVTHLQATPTFMRILAADPAARESLHSLRACLVGGEAFPPGLASLLSGQVSGVVINGYGPTETTVCATSHVLDGSSDSVPIGKALLNTRLYVVDRWNRLLPPLAPGELLIGGLGVGRGYLGRPELTAQRFIPNLFDVSDPGRLYRTGDLVRFNLEGGLEFIDRLDSQVKIRGFRIELGEIEAAMQKQPRVRQAAVVVRQEVNGEKALAGYYSCVDGQMVDESAMREALSQVLPYYMVPPVLRCLGDLPRSGSGKVDRALLASLKVNAGCLVTLSGKSSCGADAASPASSDPELVQIEQQLCSWCAELMRIPAVKPTDDYFEIGGESLTAAQLMRRIAEKYGVTLRLSALIKARTLRALGPLLTGARPSSSWSPVVPFRTTGSQPPLFLIAGLGGNVVNFEFIARQVTDRPVYGVEAQGLGSRGEMLMTLEEMARVYLAEMRRVCPLGPYHLAGYSFGGVLAFEIAQQIQRGGEKIGFLGLIDTSEWLYTRQVLNQLSRLARFDYLYGQTIRQIVRGPNRKAVLLNRLRIAKENRELARARAAAAPVEAAAASVEQRNYQALAGYLALPYNGPVHLFRTGDKTPLRGSDPTLGWGSLCESCIVEDVPGEHETLMSQAFAPELAARIQQALRFREREAMFRADRLRQDSGFRNKAA